MMRLGELANHVAARLIGNAELQIQDARSLLTASCNHITFVAEQKHLTTFLGSPCSCAVMTANIDLAGTNITQTRNLLVVDDAERAFVEIVKLFRPVPERKRMGISSRAMVSDTAQIAEDVDIHPGAFIGDEVSIGCGTVIHPNVTILDGVSIGANSILFANAVVYENCSIGNRCIIHSGVVIGAYGFGYQSNQLHQLGSQLGNVVIEDDVEIGANSTIDRGSYDCTTVGAGTKIDNLVMIGHNCQIGKHNLLCGQVGIAGSTVTGNHVVMAGQVGIGDHLHIGDRVVIAAQSGVMNDLASCQTYLGSPAIPARERMQLHAATAKLPEMRKQLRHLEKMLRKESVHNNEAA